MNLHALQYNIHWEDKPANFSHLRALLGQLRPQPGDLVVLPELSCIGFTMRREGLAEQPQGETTEFFAGLAREYGVFFVGGASWWGERELGRNMALVFDPAGRLLGAYAKQHPFSYGGESEHYQAGDDFFLFQWNGCKVAPLVCYDLRFPETFRHLAYQGAELYVVIANWPAPRVHHWEALLMARAIENQAYVLGVNRCGADPQVNYPGSSRLIDPHGKVVAQLDEHPGQLSAALDLEDLRAYRGRFPALNDLKRSQLGLS
ncbi:MAG: carbon-nitrogen family hydrolase [Candidatus Eremiobacteraeota bacterium]|nr:carbon-nitrogen family hydrolase [Candidatus Eremiobacteraeota bacterium]MCW5866493.1 carbon-nitrogen family hydrolase [Candidatus Eremiobacteraeota bacterium]